MPAADKPALRAVSATRSAWSIWKASSSIPARWSEQLKKFGDDDSIKAIIIHVNSPGGGVAASEEIYREVKRIRDEKKKHIVASIETVGASGAYYVSSATNKIYADNGSVVGSIGVIAEWVNYGDLLRWAKLKPEVLKVGEFKDTGDPTRDMTPAERAYMQALIDNMYGQFIQAVADGRHAKVEDIQVHRRRPGLDRRAGASMHTDRPDRRLRGGGRRYRQVGGNQRRAGPGASREGPQDGARPDVWRRLRNSCPPERKAAGPAHGVLLSCGSSVRAGCNRLMSFVRVARCQHCHLRKTPEI